MKAISLFSSLIFCGNIFACSIARPVYSLSAPITMLLEELELLGDMHLKAISVFHPVKNYNGQKLGGGVFLSAKAFSTASGAIVFFDKSKELSRNLHLIKTVQAIEINTRDMGVFEATLKPLALLEGYLKGCAKKIENLKEKIKKYKVEIEKASLLPENHHLLFFIDRISSSSKLPSTLMVNDSIVYTLSKELDKIETYQSPLAYVAWSSRLMKKKYKKYKKLGLVNSQDEELKIQKIDSMHYNLKYRGVLAPGIRQLYFVKQFMDKM